MILGGIVHARKDRVEGKESSNAIWITLPIVCDWHRTLFGRSVNGSFSQNRRAKN